MNCDVYWHTAVNPFNYRPCRAGLCACRGGARDDGAEDRRAISIKTMGASSSTPKPPTLDDLDGEEQRMLLRNINFSTSETRRTLENSRLSTSERCKQQCLRGLAAL